MTILQVLKKIKHLDRKITKTSTRIKRWGSHFDNEETQYDVWKLLQSVNDMIEKKAELRHSLHVTNVKTITEFRGKNITIDELIILLTVTIPGKIEMLKLLRRCEKGFNDDKNLKVIMNYDPQKRDKQIDALENLMDEAEEILDNVNITVKTI